MLIRAFPKPSAHAWQSLTSEEMSCTESNEGLGSAQYAFSFVRFPNDFEGAMRRATQVSFDLQFDGILIPFTWPSQGAVGG